MESNPELMWKQAYLRSLDDTEHWRRKNKFLENKIEELVVAGGLLRDYVLNGDGAGVEVIAEWDTTVGLVFTAIDYAAGIDAHLAKEEGRE